MHIENCQVEEKIRRQQLPNIHAQQRHEGDQKVIANVAYNRNQRKNNPPKKRQVK